MKEKFGPCIEKKCAVCCNPVKVESFFPEDEIPVNEKGEKIWEYQGILASEKTPDGIKLKAYKCKNFDEETGLCKNYKNRPMICRETTCIDEKSKESTDKQYKKFIKNKFILIKEK